MFRVFDQKSETQVFMVEDPRRAGFRGDVEEGVSLEYNTEETFLWPEGADIPDPCVGRSRENSKHYKVFKYQQDLHGAEYEFVSHGVPFVTVSWRDYVRLRLNPPGPEQIDEEDWYNYLDKVDDEARRLGQRTPWPEAPEDASRDSVAQWLAKQHFITDPTIREIWYLPNGAPKDEIRFLEISERVTGNEEKVEPFDFRVDILGSQYRLFIADMGGDQLDIIKHDAAALPPGWTLHGNTIWRRRAA